MKLKPISSISSGLFFFALIDIQLYFPKVIYVKRYVEYLKHLQRASNKLSLIFLIRLCPFVFENLLLKNIENVFEISQKEKRISKNLMDSVSKCVRYAWNPIIKDNILKLIEHEISIINFDYMFYIFIKVKQRVC